MRRRQFLGALAGAAALCRSVRADAPADGIDPAYLKGAERLWVVSRVLRTE